jgi:hypothetical protein
MFFVISFLLVANQGPHLRTPNPGFNPGFTPHICYIKGGANPGFNPVFYVLRCGLSVANHKELSGGRIFSLLRSYLLSAKVMTQTGVIILKVHNLDKADKTLTDYKYRLSAHISGRSDSAGEVNPLHLLQKLGA